jgi:hypothetical protein
MRGLYLLTTRFEFEVSKKGANGKVILFSMYGHIASRTL